MTAKFTILCPFIAVGDNGYIITAGKVQQIGTRSWHSIAYGKGKYVVVGDCGYIITSTDGENWSTPKAVTGADGAHRWHSVIYDNGMFIAVGDDYSVTTSTDGVNWTTLLSIFDSSGGNLTCVAYGNGKFITVGYRSLFYSTDAISWNNQFYDSGASDIIYVNGIFFILSRMGIIASLDGISWQSYGDLTDVNFNSIVYGNGKFITVGDNKFAVSDNAINWTVTYYYEMMNGIAYKDGFGFAAAANRGEIVKFDMTGKLSSKEKIIKENLNDICAIR